jgi:sorbitol-specific phosphotransferase system component IIC
VGFCCAAIKTIELRSICGLLNVLPSLLTIFNVVVSENGKHRANGISAAYDTNGVRAY